MGNSILWYDLETFGLEPRHDRIAQFAGLRTDEQLNPVAPRLVLYNRITPDYLPSPYACRVHGISPHLTLERGIPEYEFARAIRSEFLTPGTCVAGYNSVRFDDEFIRNLLYRNLFDPYEREWANGNSRWDVLDLFRATRDLRPEGMVWPDGPDGKPDFRLVALAEANGVALESAHDAFYDIQATIDLVRLVRDRQPRLYDWYWRHRTRDSLKPLVNLADHEPLVYTAAQFTTIRGCTAVIAPVGMVPGRRDGLVAIDLRHDPTPLFDLGVDEIRSLLFARKGTIDESRRLPLVELKLGRCPYLAPLQTLDAAAADRLGIDLAIARQRAAMLKRETGLIQKLAAVYTLPPQDSAQTDPEYRIYTGGFFRDEDRDAMESIHEALATLGPAGAKPHAYHAAFIDERLPQLVRRLFARNWPETLTTAEAGRWRSFCAARILMPPIEGATGMADFGKTVESMLGNLDTPAESKPILLELLAYGTRLETDILSYTGPGAAAAPASTRRTGSKKR